MTTEPTKSNGATQMDNAVITVKKGQALCLIIEGYEDHAATFDYEDVLQVILQQAQMDLNRIRNKKQQDRYAAEMNQCSAEKASYGGQALNAGNIGSTSTSLGLYPR